MPYRLSPPWTILPVCYLSVSTGINPQVFLPTAAHHHNGPSINAHMSLCSVRLLPSAHHDPVVPPAAPQLFIVLIVVRLLPAQGGRRRRQTPSIAVCCGAPYAPVAEDAAVIKGVILHVLQTQRDEHAKKREERDTIDAGEALCRPSLFRTIVPHSSRLEVGNLIVSLS